MPFVLKTLKTFFLATTSGVTSDALEGGEVPPSRAPSLCPAIVSLAPSPSLNGICNRQQPPPTALTTLSNRLSNRFWPRSRSLPS